MTIFQRLFGIRNLNHCTAASRVSEKMSDEEKALELARLKELSEQGPTAEERERYRRRIIRFKERGVPLRLLDKAAYDLREERCNKRQHLAA